MLALLVDSSDPLFRCEFGLRINVTVKSPIVMDTPSAVTIETGLLVPEEVNAHQNSPKLDYYL